MVHIIAKISKFFINNFELFVMLFLFFIILKGFFSPIEKRIPNNDTILISSDSLNKSILERDTHLQILLNSIHLHQGYIVQFAVAGESLQMQGRLLFITLFSALITALYSVKHKDQRRVIAFIALLVGFFWYGINIHKLDIENRGSSTSEMLNNTEIKLLNLQPGDNRFYYLDFSKIQKAIDDSEVDHKLRKIRRFITPDISDIVFNMMPLFIFALIYRIRKYSNGAA